MTLKRLVIGFAVLAALALATWALFLRDPRMALYDPGPDRKLNVLRDAPLTSRQQELFDERFARAPYFAALAVSPSTGATGGVMRVNSLSNARATALRICARRADDCTLHAEITPATWRWWHAWLPGEFLTDAQADSLRVVVPGSVTLVIGVNGKGGYHQRMFRKGEPLELENEMRVCKMMVKDDPENGFACRLIVGRHVRLGDW